MGRNMKIVIIGILILIGVWMFFQRNAGATENQPIDTLQPQANFTEVEGVLQKEIMDSIEWEIFMLAVAMEESRWSCAARNGDAIGFLQITPICVEEDNRILGKEQFTLEDRWSKERSVEIWHVIQNHHNPDHDHDKALDIWNPNHPDSYKDGVQLYYNQLTSQKES